MREQKPRYRRMDLINSMPVGEQGRIARRLGISRAYVSTILNGQCNQDSDKGIGVIRLAEAATERARYKEGKRRL